MARWLGVYVGTCAWLDIAYLCDCFSTEGIGSIQGGMLVTHKQGRPGCRPWLGFFSLFDSGQIKPRWDPVSFRACSEAVALITVCKTVSTEEGNSWAAWNSKREMEQNKRESRLPRCLRAPWRGHHERLGPRL